jgi:hypothetical protein
MIFDFKFTFPKWLARVFGAPKTRKNRNTGNTRSLMNIVRNSYGPKTKRNGPKTNTSGANRTRRNRTNTSGANDPGMLNNTNRPSSTISNNNKINLYNIVYPKPGKRFLNALEQRKKKRAA